MRSKWASHIVILVVVFVIKPFVVFPQASGIKFESGLSWKEIQAKAKAENKFIFMDCYATWCGPCKYMAQKIFTQKVAGEYFNTHFINVAVQMDQTKNDLPEVRNWYKDEKFIEKKYLVDEFPTYLFFSPDGVAVHRIIGATEEAVDFVEKASDALNPEKQYYTLMSQYVNHKNDSLYLRNAISIALKSYDNVNASAIGNLYIDCLKVPLQKDNLSFIISFTKSSKSKGFSLLLNNTLMIDNEMDEKDLAESTIRDIIYQEEITPLFKNDAPAPDWKRIHQNLKARYPKYADRILSKAKVDYFGSKKNQVEFEKAAEEYMDKYISLLGNMELNSNAWQMFLISSNPKALKEALSWSKRTLPAGEIGQPPFTDTYANILYKLGDRKNAIVWEKKAIEQSIYQKLEGNQKMFEITLKKMQNGEITWQED